MSDWLTYSPTSGHGNGIITLTATSISELDYRMNTIIAKNTDFNLSASTIVEQRTPPTSITFDCFSVEWVNDVPYSGGTASKSNCNYIVYANYSDGSQIDVTNAADVVGEMSVFPTTSETRTFVDVLELTATFDGITSSAQVDVYQSGRIKVPTADTSTYLSFQILEDGGLFYTTTGYRFTEFTDIMYSINNGEWKTLEAQDYLYEVSLIPVKGGDIVRFKQNKGYFIPGRIGVTSRHNIFGNIMSLIGGDNFSGLTSFPSNTVFTAIFCNFRASTVTTLPIDASNLILPATTLVGSCYQDMFQGCTSLINVPKLPATTLAGWCYREMFVGCTSLQSVPLNLLPAKSLEEVCYYGMFEGCTSLINVPKLPATTLAADCYYIMFAGCTSLTSAPELPATTLARGCYEFMFRYCSALTTAPELPATYLTTECYCAMFADCPNLNYIKCLATNISATNCTLAWHDGVSETGTFVKNPNMSSWEIGRNGIPSGWTVQDAT